MWLVLTYLTTKISKSTVCTSVYHTSFNFWFLSNFSPPSPSCSLPVNCGPPLVSHRSVAIYCSLFTHSGLLNVLDKLSFFKLVSVVSLWGGENCCMAYMRSWADGRGHGWAAHTINWRQSTKSELGPYSEPHNSSACGGQSHQIYFTLVLSWNIINTWQIGAKMIVNDAKFIIWSDSTATQPWHAQDENARLLHQLQFVFVFWLLKA